MWVFDRISSQMHPLLYYRENTDSYREIWLWQISNHFILPLINDCESSCFQPHQTRGCQFTLISLFIFFFFQMAWLRFIIEIADILRLLNTGVVFSILNLSCYDSHHSDVIKKINICFDIIMTDITALDIRLRVSFLPLSTSFPVIFSEYMQPCTMSAI